MAHRLLARPRRLHAALVAILVAVGVGAVSSPSASAATTYVEADAETGDLRAWNVTAAAAALPAAARRGAYGYEVNATNAAGYLNWSTTSIEQGHPHATLRSYVQVNSHAAGQSVDLVTIRNTNTSHHFDLFLTADTRRLKWDLNNINWDETAWTANYDQWYLIEVQVEFAGTDYNASVRIDGVDQGTITSTGMLDGDVKSVWLGTSNVKTHRQRYDDVAVKVGDTALGYLGPPGGAPPAVTTGCVAAQKYTLSGTVNPNGVSTAYRFEYGPTTSYGSSAPPAAAPVGSGSTAQPVSAELTGLTPATTYNYRLVASNAAGTSYGPNRTFTTAPAQAC